MAPSLTSRHNKAAAKASRPTKRKRASVTMVVRRKTNGWTQQEDNLLIHSIHSSTCNDGKPKWTTIAETIPNRTPKQCRERWVNNLRPDAKIGNWTAEEDLLLYKLQISMGNKWTSIAKIMNRTENSIKNHWHSKRHVTFRNKMVKARNASPSTSELAIGDLVMRQHAINLEAATKPRQAVAKATVNEAHPTTPFIAPTLTNDHEDGRVTTNIRLVLPPPLPSADCAQDSIPPLALESSPSWEDSDVVFPKFGSLTPQLVSVDSFQEFIDHPPKSSMSEDIQYPISFFSPPCFALRRDYPFHCYAAEEV